MRARFLFRLDDASAHSDLSKWRAIEAIFQKYGIKPIVAVIPENKDAKLMYKEASPLFWQTVSGWDQKGWDVAMHGYQHTFHNVSKKQSIIPYYDRSEFSGLGLEKQKDKIKKSLAIFRKNNIDPRVWVAPAHSFDSATLRAISDETNIRIISDGISLFPFYRSGLYFIPQQLWSIKPKLFGLWTICLHPDTMSIEKINELDRKIEDSKIYKNTISIDEIEFLEKDKSLYDYVFYNDFIRFIINNECICI